MCMSEIVNLTDLDMFSNLLGKKRGHQGIKTHSMRFRFTRLMSCIEPPTAKDLKVDPRIPPFLHGCFRRWHFSPTVGDSLNLCVPPICCMPN